MENQEKPDQYGLLYSERMDEEYLNKYALNDETVRRVVASSDVVVAERTDLRRLGTQTPYNHYRTADKKLNINDLEEVLKILYKKYPFYRAVAQEYLNGSYAYFTNIFIVKKEMFFDYCNWVFPILREAAHLIRPDQQTQQEVRVLGYISEWLWSIYLTYQKQHTALRVTELKRTFVRNTHPVPQIKPRVPNEVPVIMSCDENYAPYLGVTINSLIHHASADKAYTVYILDDGLSAELKHRLSKLETENTKIRYVDINAYMNQYPQEFFYTCAHFSVATWYRLFIPLIFSHFNKIIYCDCDAVFLADPAELCQVNLEDNLIGAIRDTEVIREILSGDTYFSAELKLKNPMNYFQAGLLLFNIPQMLKDHFTQQCLEALARVKMPRYVDQDIMNMVCEGKVHFLESAWNVENHLPIWNSFAQLADTLPYNVYREYYKTVRRAKYLHFTGAVKPWQQAGSFQADIWWQYARQTPFYETILQRMVPLAPKEDIATIKEVLRYRKLYMSYLRCRVLANFTWGNKRKHYIRKKHVLHERVRRVRRGG